MGWLWEPGSIGDLKLLAKGRRSAVQAFDRGREPGSMGRPESKPKPLQLNWEVQELSAPRLFFGRMDVLKFCAVRMFRVGAVIGLPARSG
jgi:hypothetical protein